MADRTYCGSHTTMGHGDVAVCGEPYIGGLYRCPHCTVQLLVAENNVLRETLIKTANQLDEWARQSVQGGWSTHQVDPMKRAADDMRRAAMAGAGAHKC